MKGIQFKIKNEHDNILYKILRNIDFNEYNWNIVEGEIYDSTGENYFDKDWYSNDEFQKLIRYGIYYPVFANIQMYLKQDEAENIRNYEDFINSKCQLVLFITDNEFVDIYVKNEEFLDRLYQNAVENNFENIKYIENEIYIRHFFSAYSD